MRDSFLEDIYVEYQRYQRTININLDVKNKNQVKNKKIIIILE